MLSSLLRPLEVIKKDPIPFFIWLTFAILISQIRILLVIINNWSALGWKTVILNFRLGNFYVFTITCLATGVVAWINEYYFKEEASFRGLKIGLGLISVLLVGFTLICISSPLPLDQSLNQITNSSDGYPSILLQAIVYTLSLITALYVFCISQMYRYYEDFKDLDDRAVSDLKKKASTATSTEEGIDLL